MGFKINKVNIISYILTYHCLVYLLKVFVFKINGVDLIIYILTYDYLIYLFVNILVLILME